MKRTLTVVLHNERAVSWNKLYSASHWITRKRFAQEVHHRVIIALADMGIMPHSRQHIFNNKVDIDIVAYFKNRPIDSSNINIKVYEDGLKEILLHDDSPKYVRRVSAESRVDPVERVEITLTEVE